MSFNLLIADDDPAVFSQARALLARHDCFVEAAFSGFDCLARVRAGGIDFLFLDSELAFGSGSALLPALLDDIQNTAVPPVTLLMADAVDARIEQAVASGRLLAVLPRPVDFELAFHIFGRRSNSEPVDLPPILDRQTLTTMASQAHSRGTFFLEGAPLLPPGTPVTISADTAKGKVTFAGDVDLSVRKPGKRGLGVRLSEVGAAAHELMRLLASTSSSPEKAAGQPPSSAPARSALPQPSSSDERFRRGMEKLESGKYESALIDLHQALEMSPDNAVIRSACLRAEAMAGMKKAAILFQRASQEPDPAEALKLVEDALRLDASRATYHCEAARLTIRIGGDTDKVEKHLTQAIYLAPSDPAPRHLYAQMLERSGRYQEALWACDAALQVFPDDKEFVKLAQRLRRKTSVPSPAGGDS